MEILKSLSTGQVLERAADSVPDKTAVVDGERRTTFKELNDMADAVAAGVSEMGFKKGDRIGIYMKNSIGLMAAFYALQKLGIIVVWLNPLYRKNEAQFILGNSGAKGVFVFSEWEGYDYVGSILSIKENLPGLETIIVAGEGKGEGIHPFYDLLEQGSHKTFTPPAIDPQKDLSMLLYTSGTTGTPKGAVIGHYGAVRAGWEYSLGV